MICTYVWLEEADVKRLIGTDRRKGFFLIIIINPLCVTICPETFSNLCVGGVRGM